MTRPQNQSLTFTVVVAVLVFFLAGIHPWVSYILSLLTLIMIIIASWFDSFWPSQEKQENPYVFSLFWGLVLGLLLPFMVRVTMTEGFDSLLELVSPG